MKVFEIFPETESGKKIFLNNLAVFKAKLLLESIDNLNICDKDKDDVLKKVFEILSKKSDNENI